MKRYTAPLCLALFLLFAPIGCVSMSGVFGTGEDSDLSSQYDDAGIKTSITSALLKNNATKANDIDVHCFKGHVFLVGEADKEFRKFALDTAQSTKGVVHATTHWFPTGTADTGDDAAVEEAIVQKMGTITAHPKSQVAIDAWGGHVVLTGILPTQADINQAIAIARGTPKVKSVTSYLAPN